MKCHILFSGKNNKNIVNLSSAENAQRVVKVNGVLVAERTELDNKHTNRTMYRTKHEKSPAASSHKATQRPASARTTTLELPVVKKLLRGCG